VSWGAWAVLFPSAIFSWLDMPQPNYPQFWQCIGVRKVYRSAESVCPLRFHAARHCPPNAAKKTTLKVLVMGLAPAVLTFLIL